MSICIQLYFILKNKCFIYRKIIFIFTRIKLFRNVLYYMIKLLIKKKKKMIIIVIKLRCKVNLNFFCGVSYPTLSKFVGRHNVKVGKH